MAASGVVLAARGVILATWGVILAALGVILAARGVIWTTLGVILAAGRDRGSQGRGNGGGRLVWLMVSRLAWMTQTPGAAIFARLGLSATPRPHIH